MVFITEQYRKFYCRSTHCKQKQFLNNFKYASKEKKSDKTIKNKLINKMKGTVHDYTIQLKLKLYNIDFRKFL